MGRSTVREAFGLRVDATPPIPGAIAPHGSRRPLVRIVDASDVGDEAQAAELLWSTVIDGEHVRVTRDPDRGFSVTFGRHGAFVISRDGRTIACAPAANADRVRWRRFLLDTVLWCAALLHGHVILHAGAVASDQGALAIVAPSGGGKSSLVAELVRRGRRLITDDVLVVTTDDVPLAHPGPAVMTIDARAPYALGSAIARPLATLGRERWLEILRPVDAPVQLSAVVLLERDRDGPAEVLEASDAPFLRLMAHTIALPGLPRSSARRRFAVVADVVERVPVLALRVPSSLSPPAIAERLECALVAKGRPSPRRSYDVASDHEAHLARRSADRPQ